MSPVPGPPDRRLQLRRALARHRRLLAAGCLALAVLVAIPVVAPGEPVRVPVLVAARPLPPGHLITPADLTVAGWPPEARPDGVLAVAAGRVTAGPVGRGEPLTGTRVLGPDLLAGAPAGTVAVTVRPADPAALLLLPVGSRVTVLAGTGDTAAGSATGEARRAEVLVRSALVLAPAGHDGGGPEAGDDTGALGGVLAPGAVTGAGAGAGAVVVLAVAPDEARRLAAATGTRPLTLALLRVGDA